MTKYILSIFLAIFLMVVAFVVLMIFLKKSKVSRTIMEVIGFSFAIVPILVSRFVVDLRGLTGVLVWTFQVLTLVFSTIKRKNDETELYYLNVRYYDPEVGRWILSLMKMRNSWI